MFDIRCLIYYVMIYDTRGISILGYERNYLGYGRKYERNYLGYGRKYERNYLGYGRKYERNYLTGIIK